ncbi:MAG: HAMP domain-containing sensor histidine kinase [Candidatus Velthaea sp.]
MRTRIAVWYATLIIVVIALAAIALSFAFNQILVDQARLQAEATLDEISRTIDPARIFGFAEPQPIINTLTDPQQLEHWSGPTTYVQVDTVDGYPVGKSSNMGLLTLPAPRPADFQAGDTVSRVVVLSDGTQAVAVARLLREGSRPVALALTGERLDNVRTLVKRARTILVAVTIVGALLVLGASYLIARTAIDPIERLTEAMAEIGSDRLDHRIATNRGDEVGKLADAFNAMLARLQEAFARERQFISDASHELKTPLTVINANAQMLKRWGNAEPAIRDESLEAIVTESRQLADMVTGMLTLAKADSGDQIPKAPVALDDLVRNVAAHAHDRAERKGIALEVHTGPEAMTVTGDESLLRQLVTNLVDNAIKFTDSGRIDIRLTASGATVVLEVADTGVGIDAGIADRLFDRFFRSDISHSRVIEGTGLGLAIVRSIARVHGGSVSARPRTEGGSVFVAILPGASPATVIESQ